MNTERPRGLATRAVHAGETHGQDAIRPTTTPIYHSSSFLAPSVAEIEQILAGQVQGYAYTRDGNPTVAAFERAVADLEGTEGAKAFSSGMAGIHAALMAAGLCTGSRVVAQRDCYGGTRALLSKLSSQFGIDVELVDVDDSESVEAALAIPSAVLLVETLSNPLVKVADVSLLSERAHEAGAAVIVDATFTTPVLSRPADQGADIVVHSATKFLGGHGDVTGGVVCAGGTHLKQLQSSASLMGGVLGPGEAWLCLRGLKTLLLRVERQCANAALIARHLSLHPRVARVHYPGLPDHPGHKLAQENYAGRFGAMVSFELRDGGRAEVIDFMERLKLVLPAPTLGDVATLVSYPAISSHRTLTAAERTDLGITDGLVRLSIGIEDLNDIIADLEQALR